MYNKSCVAIWRIVLGITLAVVCISATDAAIQLPSYETLNSAHTSTCSRVMPCKWSICPWSQMVDANSGNCVTIDNVGCVCPDTHECKLRADANEPFSTGLPFVKFQHLCVLSTPSSSSGRGTGRFAARSTHLRRGL